MQIRETIQNTTAILTLEGNFLCQPENTVLKTKILHLINDGIRCVIIDLGEVTCINSDGLGVLISALSTLRKAGVELRLANATDLVDNLLVLTQLVKIFNKFDSVDKALPGGSASKSS
jgi:anti-sigma B factor antagonist